MSQGVEDGYVYFIFQGVKVENIRGQMDEAVARQQAYVPL